jgi:murein DD-endopeptidase MepM/ murein hydrolase activator NlpD
MVPGATTTRQADGGAHQAQVEVRILSAPRIVSGTDGKRHIAYELRITSFYSGDEPLKLVRVAIYPDNASVPLETIEGAAIRALLARPTKEDEAAKGIPIASGLSQTLFLWLTLPPGARPASLRHQLIFEADKAAVERADDIRIPVLPGLPVRIGPPLRGGRWMAVEGPGNHRSHHWGSMVAVDGKLTIPQRFAIDWFGLDKESHSIRSQHDSLASTVDEDWVGYDADVLAVADGVVEDARDGIPNGKPLAPEETPDDLTARTLYGNFVILRIAPGVYVHYAHMKTGTLTVGIGQHVRRGMVLGRLGQTGSAGAPHLHFHVSDRPTFEQSEGLPFVIDAFTLLGHGKIEDSFDTTKHTDLQSPSAKVRRFELPLDGSVVAFP